MKVDLNKSEKRKLTKSLISQVKQSQRANLALESQLNMLKMQLQRLKVSGLMDSVADIEEKIICLEFDILKNKLFLTRYERVMAYFKEENEIDFYAFKYRYVDGLTLDAIEAKVGYSINTITRRTDKMIEEFLYFMR